MASRGVHTCAALPGPAALASDNRGAPSGCPGWQRPHRAEGVCVLGAWLWERLVSALRSGARGVSAPEGCPDLVGGGSRSDVGSNGAAPWQRQTPAQLAGRCPGPADADISGLFKGNEGTSCRQKLLPGAFRFRMRRHPSSCCRWTASFPSQGRCHLSGFPLQGAGGPPPSSAGHQGLRTL